MIIVDNHDSMLDKIPTYCFDSMLVLFFDYEDFVQLYIKLGIISEKDPIIEILRDRILIELSGINPLFYKNSVYQFPITGELRIDSSYYNIESIIFIDYLSFMVNNTLDFTDIKLSKNILIVSNYQPYTTLITPEIIDDESVQLAINNFKAHSEFYSKFKEFELQWREYATIISDEQPNTICTFVHYYCTDVEPVKGNIPTDYIQRISDNLQLFDIRKKDLNLIDLTIT